MSKNTVRVVCKTPSWNEEYFFAWVLTSASVFTVCMRGYYRLLVLLEGVGSAVRFFFFDLSFLFSSFALEEESLAPLLSSLQVRGAAVVILLINHHYSSVLSLFGFACGGRGSKVETFFFGSIISINRMNNCKIFPFVRVGCPQIRAIHFCFLQGIVERDFFLS